MPRLINLLKSATHKIELLIDSSDIFFDITEFETSLTAVKLLRLR